MKVNHRRLAAGRENLRHYEAGIKSKGTRRKDDSNRERREFRELIHAR